MGIAWSMLPGGVREACPRGVEVVVAHLLISVCVLLGK